MLTRWQLDHLVVAARTLEDGVAWCESVLGVTPAPGGKHPLMGTHNRLLAIGSPAFPRAYLELIAIDPEAPPPGRPRWFDLDDPALQRLLTDGPRLVHWVARSAAIEADRQRLHDAGADPGEVTAAERATPRGVLHWRITLRTDGRRQCGGAVPALIAWGAQHPTDTLPASGVTLEALTVAGLPAAARDRLPAGATEAGPAALSALLHTARRAVRLAA